ncbi:hypothetical protein [Streptomyces sp. NPDC057682]|uniref:hypothetical protein n=1 Tax=Streptomyces sp. NPDC057682 TaxID=3346210 RepID=UPI003687D0CD
MGTSRAWGRRTTRRFPAAFALAAAAVAGLTACEPGNGLNTASIAVTTDSTATRALEHEGVHVQWLSCTASTDGGDGGAGSPSTSAERIASVDCNGRTKEGKDISVSGRVDREVEGRCVRGDMTAKAAGRTVFRASLLGNCSAPPSTRAPVGLIGGGSGGGGGGGARPTVTVTVTVTEHPQGK